MVVVFVDGGGCGGCSCGGDVAAAAAACVGDRFQKSNMSDVYTERRRTNKFFMISFPFSQP